MMNEVFQVDNMPQRERAELPHGGGHAGVSACEHICTWLGVLEKKQKLPQPKG